MAEPLKLCGVILAAGRSSRMGSEKALLPWPPGTQAQGASRQSLLAASIAALKTISEAVVVVAGTNAGALASEVSAGGAALVRNPDPDRGQFSSLQTGLQEALARGYGAAVVTPVDCPPLSSATMQRLRTAFEQAIEAGKWAVEPENGGLHGHPLLAGGKLIDAFLRAPATSNAREVKQEYRDLIEYVSVPETLNVDLNTPGEYRALIAREILNI